jgi:hypothetical protein
VANEFSARKCHDVSSLLVVAVENVGFAHIDRVKSGWHFAAGGKNRDNSLAGRGGDEKESIFCRTK